MRRKKKSASLNGHRISEVLTELTRNLNSPTISFGELRDQFPARFYGFLLFILALPNLVPIPAPGLSAVMGVPLVILTFQLMLGLEVPWFPNYITKRKLKASSLQRVCKRAIPVIQKLEVVIKPRLHILVRPPADRVIAFFCLILSLVVMLPIPFGNALPALAICFFAIALLQKDGLFSLLGMAVGGASVFIVAASIGAAVETVQEWLGF